MRWYDTRRQHKIRALLGSAALFVLAIQFGIHAALILKSQDLPAPTPSARMSSSGTVAVFTGDGRRIEAALGTAIGLKPAWFFITRTNLQEMKYWRVRERLPVGTLCAMDLDALTTDGNARALRDHVRAQGIRRVVLVTSWYHVPRAYLLSSGYLRGSGAKIRTLCARRVPPRFFLRWLFWQEMGKDLGSLYRVARHAIKTM